MSAFSGFLIFSGFYFEAIILSKDFLERFGYFPSIWVLIQLLVFGIFLFKKGFWTSVWISSGLSLIAGIMFPIFYGTEVWIKISILPMIALVATISYGAIGILAITFTLAVGGKIVGIIAGTIFVIIAGLFTFLLVLQGGSILVPFMAVFVLSLCCYASQRAFLDDNKFSWIRQLSFAAASNGGTSFRLADLTDADFSQATLKNTDFRSSILTRTDFAETNGLSQARLANTILHDPKIQQLVVTKNGQGKSFDNLNLEGINFTKRQSSRFKFYWNKS